MSPLAVTSPLQLEGEEPSSSVDAVEPAGLQLGRLATTNPNSKHLSKYYKKQNELLDNFDADAELVRKISTFSAASMGVTDEEAQLMSGEPVEETAEKGDISEKAQLLAKITLAVNVTLVFAKAGAAWLSGSISIISSLADSIVDITSGLLILLASRAIKIRDPYKFPRGRTRLESISLVVISVIMGFASFQLILESVKRIFSGDTDVNMNVVSAVIMISTIVVKTVLAIVCRRSSDVSVRVLAMDHRNDCLSNGIALVCAAFTPLKGSETTFIGTPGWGYLDPIGAILVAIFILKTWYETGRDHVTKLSGRSSDPEFRNRIIKLAMDHDSRVLHVDNVYVYHLGMNYLVEVDIVLPIDMPLKQTHDIAEDLQIGIEALPDVERAFVHVDYEFRHKARHEHKIV